jgi:choline monooxygenase
MMPFDPSLPLSQAHTLPADWYTRAEMAQRERDRLFANVWLVAGRADQVRQPGDFFTCDLAGEPLVVTRDETGTLHALYNVCRHRAAKVACAEQGNAPSLRCRYHGWTYDLAGRLRGVPEFAGVENFCREENGLPRLSVGEWGPFIWVHLGEQPPALPQWLAPLQRRGLLERIEGLEWSERREYRLACNWKVFVDNYLDGGYHVNTVHPALADVLDYSHYRTENEGVCSIQISPLTTGNVDDVRTGSEAHYAWVFPHAMINVYQDVMDVNIVIPEGPESCRVIFDFYFAPHLDAAYRKRSIEVAHAVQLEDEGVCLDVQAGLRSRSYSTGRFSVKREAGGYHFHQLLAARLMETTMPATP